MTTLTRQQLKKLTREATALSEWTTVCDFANQVYGAGKAVKIEIETYGEYNDEGGTDYNIESIIAYDKDGKELTPDYSQPFFLTKEWKDAVSVSDSEEDDEEDKDKFLPKFNEIFMTDEEQQRGNWVLFEDLPVEDKTYDLTIIPTLSLLP